MGQMGTDANLSQVLIVVNGVKLRQLDPDQMQFISFVSYVHGRKSKGGWSWGKLIGKVH